MIGTYLKISFLRNKFLKIWKNDFEGRGGFGGAGVSVLSFQRSEFESQWSEQFLLHKIAWK